MDSVSLSGVRRDLPRLLRLREEKSPSRGLRLGLTVGRDSGSGVGEKYLLVVFPPSSNPLPFRGTLP